jgi:hypothetical protein
MGNSVRADTARMSKKKPGLRKAFLAAATLVGALYWIKL